MKRVQKKSTIPFPWKNIIVLCLSLLIAYVVSRNNYFQELLMHLGNWGYLGVFFAGILFVSSFTVIIGTILLVEFSYIFPIWVVVLIAGLGAVIGDLTIFRFIEDSLADYLAVFIKKITHSTEKKFKKSPYIHWLLPIIGALIVASPFPDEIGVSLMGISKMNTLSFILISLFLNMAGIFFVVGFVSALS